MSAIAMSSREVLVDVHRPARAPRPAGPVRQGRAVAARPAQGDLHLTRRGRVVMVLLALVVVLAGVMGGRAVADGPERGTEVQPYAVQSGDTLWQIASTVAAPGEDVRDVIIRLQDLNGMSGSDLSAGQVLLLPVEP